MSRQQNFMNIIEAALLAAGRPLDTGELLALFEGETEKPDRKNLREIIGHLQEDWQERSLELIEVASGYRFQVKADYARWMGRLWAERPPRYSRALLETLALIAYRQPVTRAEIEDVRGVAVSPNIIKTLLEREWIRVLGHRDVPGRPALFGTTKDFLDALGLKTLEDLPPLAEIRDIENLHADLFDGLDNNSGQGVQVAAGADAGPDAGTSEALEEGQPADVGESGAEGAEDTGPAADEVQTSERAEGQADGDAATTGADDEETDLPQAATETEETAESAEAESESAESVPEQAEGDSGAQEQASDSPAVAQEVRGEESTEAGSDTASDATEDDAIAVEMEAESDEGPDVEDTVGVSAPELATGNDALVATTEEGYEAAPAAEEDKGFAADAGTLPSPQEASGPGIEAEASPESEQAKADTDNAEEEQPSDEQPPAQLAESADESDPDTPRGSSH